VEEPRPDAKGIVALESFEALSRTAAVANSASGPGPAAAALADYLLGVAGKAASSEDAVCTAMALLSPARTVPDTTLAAALAVASGEPQLAALKGEALATRAMEWRRRAAVPDKQQPPLSTGQVADALARCAEAEGEAASAAAGELASLIAGSSAEGTEVLFLIRCFQGNLGISREVMNRAVASALTRSSASRAMTT